MRIALISDYHAEFGEQRLPPFPQDIDVLILAGDIATNEYGAVWAYTEFAHLAKHVVYVAGNHEGYGYVLNDVHERLRTFCARIPNMHFLEKETVEIDGYAFIGATCWTDYTVGNAGSQPMNMIHAKQLNDFRRIQWRTDDLGTLMPLTADICLAENEASKEFIFSEVEKYGRDKSIVVTHHAPTPLSISPKFQGDSLNCCFVNGWENELVYRGPMLWAHGHVHDPFDYTIGDTRVVCNPKAYPNERKDVFEWKIINL